MSLSYYRWLLLPLCALSTAQAGVLLEKITYPGYVMPSYALSKSCTIQDNEQLVIQHQLDGMSSKRTLPLQLSKASIKAKIAEAETGTIRKNLIIF